VGLPAQGQHRRQRLHGPLRPRLERGHGRVCARAHGPHLHGQVSGAARRRGGERVAGLAAARVECGEWAVCAGVAGARGRRALRVLRRQVCGEWVV